MEGCAIDALMLDLSAKHSTGINEPNRPETPRPSAKADAYPTTHELRTMQQFCKQLRRFASMQPTEEMLRNNPSCKTPPAHIASDPEFEILCAGADLWRQWRVQGEGRAATNSRDFKRIDFDVAVKHHGDILVSIFKVLVMPPPLFFSHLFHAQTVREKDD